MLLKMYDLEKASATSTLGDQLCQSRQQRKTHTLARTRQKLYRTAVGQLLWAMPVRPDLSFAVTDLSKSLQAPTLQDEQQLKNVLRYIKGTLHFTSSLQPPRKRVIERASSIPLQVYFDSAWVGSTQKKKSTEGTTLALWGVPLATSSRPQASLTTSSVEAELHAMGIATHAALHLRSLLQEMHLSQLAKPCELTVYTDSSSGKALASQLGLTKRTKHVQLGYWFKQPWINNGQLTLRRVSTGKNPAAMLTKQLSASTLHKLLPKLGVRTRAADFYVNVALLASPGEVKSSFFIGLMAEQPVTAQLVTSRVASRPILNSSLHTQNREAFSTLHASQRSFILDSFRRCLFFVVAFLGAANYVLDPVVSFQMYGFSLAAILALMKLYWILVIVHGPFASTRTSLQRALETTSSCLSVALKSLTLLSLPRSILRTNPRTPAQLSAYQQFDLS